jgi:cyclohexadieny/prephenate dehydrogenase
MQERPFEPFETLALIGIGLIGSSLARRVMRDGLARRIVLYDAAPMVRDRARALGLGEVVDDVTVAVREANLVILCVPVGVSGGVASDIAPHLKPGAIVSDVGSTKSSVVAQMAPHLPPQIHLVPAHPVAGTEHSGPDAGFAELFDGRWAIVTPPLDTDRAAVDRIADFWRACGSNVEEMTPEHHDMVLAITSHIPHLIAYNIVGTADDLETVTQSEVIKFSAGGFRDFTRIAASDPTMWRDVFLHNKEAVLEMLGRFSEDLALLTRAIRFGDAEFLHRHFSRTRAIRRGILQAGQDTAVADFGRRQGAAGDQNTGGKAKT